MYRAVDVLCFVFHSAWTVFVLFGWLWTKARRVHLAAVLLTAFSWFGLGLWFGFGYCPFTDWHWQAREALGYKDIPTSYIAFLVNEPTGWAIDAHLVDMLTVAAFLIAAALSLYVNFRRPAN
jgi:hypothetical protein